MVRLGLVVKEVLTSALSQRDVTHALRFSATPLAAACA
jgi:hypothetical protein